MGEIDLQTGGAVADKQSQQEKVDHCQRVVDLMREGSSNDCGSGRPGEENREKRSTLEEKEGGQRDAEQVEKNGGLSRSPKWIPS